MRVEESQLKAFILDAGLTTKDKIDKAEKKAKKLKKKLADVLIQQKIITKEQIIKLKAYILGIPFVNLEKEIIPLEILKIILPILKNDYEIGLLDDENNR